MEIKWEYTAYAGANRTGYSWAQMRVGDIPDIFITSQIIDEDLAKERLVNLADYDFINGLSTSLLDQMAIDGGIYALPVNNTMYGIYYNKTLMDEHGWELPENFAELEALCGQIREAGMEPGYIGMQLTGVPFATVFNLAKTGWFSMYSPSSYIGISRRLTEPGNEQKLENAIKLLSLLFSAEGQAAFITEQTPCVLSVLNHATLPEDALIYDAQQAMREGRAFLMTYVGWENILSDIGQAYKDWFRGGSGMNDPGCIARMDELQSGYLSNQDAVYFCAEVATMITFGSTREYAVMTMTGAQVRELAETGFDAGNGAVYPYVLVTRGGGKLEDGEAYRVAFAADSYTGEVGEAYNVQIENGTLSTFVRTWLEEQKTVSPDGNPWE